MKISSSVKHSRTRITSLVALLILAVLGSSWAVLRADVPRVASGTWAAAGEVVIPSGAVVSGPCRWTRRGSGRQERWRSLAGHFDVRPGVRRLGAGRRPRHRPIGPRHDRVERRSRADRRGNGFRRSDIRHRDLRPGERHIGSRRRHDAGARRSRRRDPQGRPRAHRRRFRRRGAAEPRRDIRSRDRAERASPTSCPPLASGPRPPR